MYTKAYFPLYQRNGVTISLITTDREGSIIDDLENEKKVNASFPIGFSRISRFCDACQLKEDEKEIMKCRHNCQMMPVFQSQTRGLHLQQIYEALGMGDDLAAEIFSIKNFQRGCYLSAKSIHAMLEPEVVPNTYRPAYIIVGIDTTGGGRSDLAMVAVGYQDRDGIRMILAIAAFRATIDVNRQTKHYSVTLFQELRQRFPETKIFVACENVPQGTMLQVYEAMNEFSNFWFVCSAGPRVCRGLGIPITKPLKETYFTVTSNQMDKGAIHLAKDHAALTNLPLSLRGTTFASPKIYLRELLRAEMLNIRRDKDGHITGKVNGLNDDLVMALVYAIYGNFLLQDRETRVERSIVDRYGISAEEKDFTTQLEFLQFARSLL